MRFHDVCLSAVCLFALTLLGTYASMYIAFVKFYARVSLFSEGCATYNVPNRLVRNAYRRKENPEREQGPFEEEEDEGSRCDKNRDSLFQCVRSAHWYCSSESLFRMEIAMQEYHSR